MTSECKKSNFHQNVTFQKLIKVNYRKLNEIGQNKTIYISDFIVDAGSETVSECPEFDCKEPKCWALTSPHDTYLYLEDGTRCPGCKTCVMSKLIFLLHIVSLG